MSTTSHKAAVIISLALSAATVESCSREARGAAVPPEALPVVRVAEVTRASSATISATGTLGAKDEIPLAFKIGGVVSRVLVDEGARVHKGQPLAELDLREIDAGVAKATAAADKARRDADRAGRLYHDSVATLSQFQDAQTARDAADADLRAASVNREYSVIAAPSDGVILKRSVNAGAQVSSGAQIVLFGSATRGAVVRVGLADRDVVRVHESDAAVVEFDALSGREFSGRVRQVGASADPRTGTYAVEIALDGAETLPSGLVGRVKISARGTTRATDASVTAIPADALVQGAGDTGTVFVFRASDARALRRSVQLVGVDGDRVLVRGLDGVNSVVAAGAAWLKDSARVEVKP